MRYYLECANQQMCRKSLLNVVYKAQAEAEFDDRTYIIVAIEKQRRCAMCHKK